VLYIPNTHDPQSLPVYVGNNVQALTITSLAIDDGDGNKDTANDDSYPGGDGDDNYDYGDDSSGSGGGCLTENGTNILRNLTHQHR
jgi:hypothetical protein